MRPSIGFLFLILNCVQAQVYSDAFDFLKDFGNESTSGNILNAPFPSDVSGLSIKFLTTILELNNNFQKVANNLRNSANISEQCNYTVGKLLETMGRGQLWPIKFLDATAKVPAGLAQGALTFLGSYDECMSIKNTLPGSDEEIVGQYCPIRFLPQKKLMGIIELMLKNSVIPKTAGLSLRWDICIPTNCTGSEIAEALNASIADIEEGLVEVISEECRVKDNGPLNGGEITALVIFSFLGAFILAGTGLDVTLRIMNYFDLISPTHEERIKDKTLSKVLLSFSYYTNGKKLLNTDMAPGSLTAVNGIRFLSMSWVILGHAYFFINTSIVGNLFQAQTLAEDFFFQAILNATVSVDTFFVLSGLLVAFVGIKGLQAGRVNWGLYYFHRIWRLTPAYAFVILFSLLWPLLGSGPTWFDNNAAIVSSCRTHWWSALLYINNLYRNEKMCLAHGWYLADDMQFYLVSPIILLAMHKKPILGFIINFVFLMTTVIINATLGTVYNLPPIALFFQATPNVEMFQKTYIASYCRMGPYCIGLYIGYFLATKKTLNIKLRWHTLLWCLAIINNVTMLYGSLNWNKGMQSPTAVNALYFSVHRILWALGVAWVIIACSTGHGGIVNSILSWRAFIPLGRMTYLAYLIHPLIQLGYSGLLRERLIYTHYEWVVMFLGFLFISYGFAFGASLAVEAPFLGLEKILLAKLGGPKPKLVKETDGPEVQSVSTLNASSSSAETGFENRGYVEDVEKHPR